MLILIKGMCHVLDEYFTLAPAYFAPAVITEFLAIKKADSFNIYIFVGQER